MIPEQSLKGPCWPKAAASARRDAGASLPCAVQGARPEPPAALLLGCEGPERWPCCKSCVGMTGENSP